MTDAPAPNADQRDFWNDRPGQTWARLQPLLDIQHAEAADILFDRARLSAGEAVLDIGCGGGETTLRAARTVGPEGRAVGLDISAPILGVARARADEAGLGQVSFVEADAQLYRATAPFDIALSRFGVMFFDDPVAGFASIAAQVRPGGRVCWIVWAGPQHNMLFRVTAEVANDHLGAGPPPDPTEPGPMALQDVDRVTALMHLAGFRDAAGEPVDGRIALPEEAAPLLVSELGPIAQRVRLDGGTAAQRDAICADVLARFAPHLDGGVYRLPARYIVYTAVRP